MYAAFGKANGRIFYFLIQKEGLFYSVIAVMYQSIFFLVVAAAFASSTQLHRYVFIKIERHKVLSDIKIYFIHENFDNTFLINYD